MNQLSDAYIHDLKPETMRYDVSLESDFAISVLPNGIKTWAFLYEYQGRQRRKTLGVYPDMTYEQAAKARDDARAMIERLGGEIDTPVEDIPAPIAGPAEAAVVKTMPQGQRPAVLASGYRPYPRPKTRPSRPWGRYGLYALGVLAMLGGGAGAWVYLNRDAAPPSSVRATVSASAPAVKQPPRSNPFAASSVAKGASSEAADSAATPGDTASASGDEAGSGGDRQSESDTGTAPAPPPASSPGDSGAPGPAEPQADATVGARDAAARSAQAVVTPPPSVTARARDTVVPADAPAADDAARVSPPAKATSVGGSVPRAIVTSGVDQLEPIDNLNDSVIESQGRYRSVFFFTELRNFSDGDIVHRWEYNGRLIADVPLKVRKSWRWRTYSSKDLLPGMTGDWSVAVVDADGEILARSAFRFAE